MHKTQVEVGQFLTEMNDVQVAEHVRAVVCAPFPYLRFLVEKTAETNIAVAALSMHYETSGAFDGEVRPTMLKDIGVTHVIIGHSESREYFNETDEAVNKKVIAAHKHELIPIVCVGESLAQREANETLAHIEQQ